MAHGEWTGVLAVLLSASFNQTRWFFCADLQVMFSLEKKLFRLVVDGIRAQDGQMTNAELAAMKHFLPPLYLGSAPDALHKELKVIYTQSCQKREK